MPFLENNTYNSQVPFLHKNAHFSTIYAGKFKKFKSPEYNREEIDLADGDFLEIDFNLKNKSKKAVILCHGLEGNSQRTYINSCATLFLENDYSIFAWNNRTCSGKMNRLPKLYHHASIEDLDAVVKFALNKGIEQVYLIGFSMGGAQVLNYLGRIDEIDSRVKAGVSVSVPIEIKASADSLKKGFNKVYMYNFLIGLKQKLKIKASQFPEIIQIDKVKQIRDFDFLDDNFTAPLHGFTDRHDYYFKVSPARSLANVTHPVLILNSYDDPFLGEGCFPIDFAKENKVVHLETVNYGGHCAFPLKDSEYSYAEIRALEFIKSNFQD